MREDVCYTDARSESEMQTDRQGVSAYLQVAKKEVRIYERKKVLKKKSTLRTKPKLRP